MLPEGIPGFAARPLAPAFSIKQPRPVRSSEARAPDVSSPSSPSPLRTSLYFFYTGPITTTTATTTQFPSSRRRPWRHWPAAALPLHSSLLRLRSITQILGHRQSTSGTLILSIPDSLSSLDADEKLYVARHCTRVGTVE